MLKLSDKQLIDAYNHAVQLDLDEEFLTMLREELEKRNLHLSEIIS